VEEFENLSVINLEKFVKDNPVNIKAKQELKYRYDTLTRSVSDNNIKDWNLNMELIK